MFLSCTVVMENDFLIEDFQEIAVICFCLGLKFSAMMTL